MSSAGTSSKPTSFYEDYDSDFEYDTEVGEKRKARQDLAAIPEKRKAHKPNKQEFHEECSREQGKFRTHAYLALDAYTRHKKLINEYVLCYRGATEKLKRSTDNCKTDHDVIRENHKFLWEEEDEAKTWGQQLAKTYYDRLFKEYCLCDLSRYKERKIGMRWRTEKELIVGKGQFFCGSVHCELQENLNSWEVMFGYVEHGVKKSALVKLRLCEKCSDKLHYGYKGKIALKSRKKSKAKEVEDAASSIEEEASEKTSDSPKNKNGQLNESEIWKQPVKIETEPDKADVFEEFLEDLFL